MYSLNIIPISISVQRICKKSLQSRLCQEQYPYDTNELYLHQIRFQPLSSVILMLLTQLFYPDQSSLAVHSTVFLLSISQAWFEQSQKIIREQKYLLQAKAVVLLPLVVLALFSSDKRAALPISPDHQNDVIYFEGQCRAKDFVMIINELLQALRNSSFTD